MIIRPQVSHSTSVPPLIFGVAAGALSVSQPGNGRGNVLFDGFVFLQQGGIYLIHYFFGFCPLVFQLALLAFGFLFIISLELVKGFLGVGRFQTDAALQLFIGVRFLDDAADFHLVLTDCITAATDLGEERFDFIRCGGRRCLKTLLKAVQLFPGTDDGLGDDILAVYHSADILFYLLILLLTVEDKITGLFELLPGRRTLDRQSDGVRFHVFHLVSPQSFILFHKGASYLTGSPPVTVAGERNRRIHPTHISAHYILTY